MSEYSAANYMLLALLLLTVLTNESQAMTKKEKKAISNEVKEMFYHGYRNYMNNAYPHDELMPLSCKGRFRGTLPSRGDVDDILGNFSLTLVDSFDTLVILGDIEEFEKAVQLVIKDVSFDRDIVVSVFETNIRMLGGLLSGHVLADKLRRRGKGLQWYGTQLLDLAKDLGYRLLPAFNTSTGIPYPRVNLIHGVKQEMARTGHEKDTCTACAGTMVLEFAALSRLTGEPIFEAKAHKAMDSLWQYRHRTSNLVGTVINIHNGEWVRRDAGIGAGTDSYYEYLLKAYILLGDDTYLDRFNKHYESIMKYISQGPIMLDVHMHRPHSNSKNFMDSLFAFWPGLQVLKGDIKPAIVIHEMLYQVMQRHNFLPEAFTTDFRVHWAQHPLRPEFIESTYFLYRATGDPHYLDVGKKVVDNLNKHARVSCGYASIRDVTTGKHEDQMDSFVLSETFKYLYLLFSEEEDLLINIDDFIFTTEAHLLPLTLSLHETSKNITLTDTAILYNAEEEESSVDESDRTCPNNAHVFKNNMNFVHSLRVPLKNMVESVCPKPRQGPRKPRLHASQFIAGNTDQVSELQRMGIKIVTMSDGRVQLLHTASEAGSVEDAEDGMLFMQEMIELSKTQAAITQHETRVVQVLSEPFFGNEVFSAGPAQFGYNLQHNPGIKGKLAIAEPVSGCTLLSNDKLIAGNIAIVERGNCMFVDKARNLELAGAIGGIVMDNAPGSNTLANPVFAMSGDGKDDVSIPMVFLFRVDGEKLKKMLNTNLKMKVFLGKEAMSADLILQEALMQHRSKDRCVKESTLSQMIGVSVKTFAEAEPKSSNRLTFHTLSGKPLFRILHNVDTQKVEFEFEKNALQESTKLKMSKLIEKVVKLIQTNINFGSMDLREQSDYLFSLGKLMESSVNDNTDNLLESKVKKVLEDELLLTHTDLVETIEQQDSQLDDHSYAMRDQRRKLKENIEIVLDRYIEEQLNQVYKEASHFLENLGKTQQKDTPTTTNIGDTDQSLQTPETDVKSSSMPDVQTAEAAKENAGDKGNSPHVEDTGSQPMESFEKFTRKVKFITKDGKEKHANFVDIKSPGWSQNKEKVSSEKLREAYSKVEEAKYSKQKGDKLDENPLAKSGVKILKPPDWMILKDDEIFVDAEGTIYANYGYDVDTETDKNENIEQEARNSRKETVSNKPVNSEDSVHSRDEIDKEAIHKFEQEVKYGRLASPEEKVQSHSESAGQTADHHHSSVPIHHHQNQHQSLEESSSHHHQNEHDHNAPSDPIDENAQDNNNNQGDTLLKNIPTVKFDTSYMDLEEELFTESSPASESSDSVPDDITDSLLDDIDSDQQGGKKLLTDDIEYLTKFLLDLSDKNNDDDLKDLDKSAKILEEVNEFLRGGEPTEEGDSIESGTEESSQDSNNDKNHL